MTLSTKNRSAIENQQLTGSEISAAETNNKSSQGKAKAKKLSKLQERLTAFHEAGHAVAHYLFGDELDYVTIIPNFEKGELGRTQPVRKTFCPEIDFGYTFSMDGRAAFEREVITSLAGHIAEIKHRHRRSKFSTALSLSMTGRKLELYSDKFPLGDGDFHTVRECFDGYTLLNNSEFLLGQQEREIYFQYLWLRTVNMITSEQSWNAVTAVAEALLIKKRLRGKEAKKIMAEKIPFRHFINWLNLTSEQIQPLFEEDCTNNQLKAAA